MQNVTNQQLISESKEWFKDQYRRMTLLSGGLIVLCSLSVLLNIVQYALAPGPKYFAQTPDLRITELSPLNETYITQEGLIGWLVPVVNKTLSLGFTDWKQKLTEVQPEFFDKAFSEYVKSMKDNGTIDLISSKRLVMNPTLTAAPIIANKGANEEGVMSWKIEFPVLIGYESSQGVFLNQSLDVTVLVERVSVLSNTKGVMIRQLILKPSKGK